MRLRIHFVRQLFQHAAEAVDVLDDVVEVGLSRERNLGRQVTAAHAFGPVAQVAHEPEPPAHAVDQQCQHGNGRKREDQRDPVGQHAAGEGQRQCRGAAEQQDEQQQQRPREFAPEEALDQSPPDRAVADCRESVVCCMAGAFAAGARDRDSEGAGG